MAVTSLWQQLSTPLRVVVALIGVGAVLVGLRTIEGDPSHHLRLRQAAGLEPGDEVRVAGITVGKVATVEAVRDQVEVTFTVTADPDRVGLTDDTLGEVKLLSVLGERYLALTPGSGTELEAGDTVAVEHARDSYTMEQFWLESVPQIEELDMGTVEEAVDVLATDLSVRPGELRRALDGISGVAGMVETREQQLDALLASTEDVTTLVLDQTEHLDTALTNGTAVLAMVHDRRETLRLLLRQGHRFVTGLAALVRENAPHLKPTLRRLQQVLATFEEHRDDLDETLELAGPTMRVFTNATGDGPWLGVNAPYAIIPDDLICSVTPEECS